MSNFTKNIDALNAIFEKIEEGGGGGGGADPIRKAGWENIAALPYENNVMYFVLDRTADVYERKLVFSMKTENGAKLKKGRISNGVFVEDATVAEVVGGRFVRNLEYDFSSETSNYITLQLTENANADFTFSFESFLAPVVEAAGNCANLGSSSIWSTLYLKIDSRSLKNVTAPGALFQYALNVEKFDFSHWGDSVISGSSLNSFLKNCRALKEVDFSGIDFSNYSFTNILDTIPSKYCLVKANLGNLGSGIDSSYTGTFYLNIPATMTGLSLSWSSPCNLSLSDGTSNNYYAQLLNRESLVNLLESLPTVETTKTLYITGVNVLKLTEEELAAAQEKGWTIA